MMKANLHSHSPYCDGKAPMEEMVKGALRKGLKILGISSHAPVPFKNSFSIPGNEQLRQYRKEVRYLQDKYKDQIAIYLSLEIDYIQGMTKDFESFKKEFGLDYTIGSIHLVKGQSNDHLWFIDGPDASNYDRGLRDAFGSDIYTAVSCYYHQINEMITTQKPDMIGHIDKIKMHNHNRYFSEDESWYRQLVDETLDYVKANDCILEVNTRGVYKGRSDSLFPGHMILQKALEQNIPISLNSDAHKPDEMDGYYTEAMRFLKSIGFREMYYYSQGDWKAFALD
ncbi:MAG: histidinol-phosphatase [Bacteroidales bacterium]|nr:histidinol-phosphatase [Bacteroidales bacterium]MCF8337452.1 histidinol-phosphatase [Bacteroidales bacterium]